MLHYYFQDHRILKQRCKSSENAEYQLYKPTEGPMCALDGGWTWQDSYPKKVFTKYRTLDTSRHTITQWYQSYLGRNSH